MTALPSSAEASSSFSSAAWRSPEFLTVLLLIGLTGGLLLARLGSAEPLGSANDRSRWCTVAALADQQTYIIDEVIKIPGWDTIDKVRHEGHFYSTKPPLYPTVLAGLYWSIRQTTGMNLYTHTKLVAQIILLITNILPFLIALYCWWRVLIRAGYQPETRLLLVGLTGLATTLTPYLTVLNNHTPGGTSLMLALAAAAAILLKRSPAEDSSDENAAGWLFAACGFFAALTCCNELPAALFGLGIFGILFWHDWKKTAIWFVPAALVPLIAFFVTTYWATGSWKPFYMYYGTEKYVYEHLGVPSYWSEPRGLDKASDSVPAYIFHCLIGHHGIFSLTPLFLLMIPGYWLGIRNRQGAMRLLHGMGLVLTFVILAFYWKRTENYNYGGVSVALRWVVWLIPFWLLAMAEFLNTRLKSLRWTCLVILLGVPSLYSAWGPWNTPWQHPWLFNLLSNEGWIDYSDPPEPFEREIRSWLTQLPESSAMDPEYWIEFGNAQGERLRLSDAGSTTVEQQPARTILAETRDKAGRLLRTRRWTISPEMLLSGADPANFLLQWEDNDPSATRELQLTFLRGVPAASHFRPGHDRFLFTPLRVNAFRCRRMASRIVYRASENRPPMEHRVDAWVSEELPYGLAQLQLTVTDLNRQMLLSLETWQVKACGKTGLKTNSP